MTSQTIESILIERENRFKRANIGEFKNSKVEIYTFDPSNPAQSLLEDLKVLPATLYAKVSTTTQDALLTDLLISKKDTFDLVVDGTEIITIAPKATQITARGFLEALQKEYNFDEIEISQKERSVTLTMTIQDKLIEVKPGDISKGQLQVTLQDVGIPHLKVQTRIFRLVCSNGLESPETTSRSDSTNPSQFLGMVATAYNRLDQRLEAFKALTEKKIEDPVGYLSAMLMRYRFSKKSTTKVLDAYNQEPGDSMYEIVNALTRVATHDLETPEIDRDYLQKISSHILVSDACECPFCGN